MRILFIGDIVGRPGVRLVQDRLLELRAERGIDIVIANAENATNGSGCSPAAFRQLRESGVDLVTLGDHIYKKAEIIGVLQQDERICKPANFPPAAPGREFALAKTADGTSVAVISLLGRTFMRPVDCPFQAVDRVLKELTGLATVVIVDMHAEATADKYLMAHFLAGRIAAVLGTHTHVPTADEQIMAGGTAFICDVGMTGAYGGILGRKVEPILNAAITHVPAPFDVAAEDVRLGGAIVDVDAVTGKATRIERLMVKHENSNLARSP
jgi:metallophosphoesterase (TIGR00282 family)